MRPVRIFPLNDNNCVLLALCCWFRAEFAGFNLVYSNLFAYGERSPVVYLVSNRPQPALGVAPSAVAHDLAHSIALPDGIHGLSNGHFNDNSWGKVSRIMRGVVGFFCFAALSR